ncbi:uncharacterized protein LOC144291790 isoform X2 [Canis aureus]
MCGPRNEKVRERKAGSWYPAFLTEEPVSLLGLTLICCVVNFLYQELHFEMDLTLSTSSSLSYITPSDQRGIFTGVVMMWETKTKEKIKLAYRLQPIGRKKEIKIRYHGNQISTPNTGLTHVTEINSRILFLLCQPDLSLLKYMIF